MPSKSKFKAGDVVRRASDGCVAQVECCKADRMAGVPSADPDAHKGVYCCITLDRKHSFDAHEDDLQLHADYVAERRKRTLERRSAKSATVADAQPSTPAAASHPAKAGPSHPTERIGPKSK